MKIKDLFKNLKKKKENETNAENLKENSRKDIFL